MLFCREHAGTDRTRPERNTIALDYLSKGLEEATCRWNLSKTQNAQKTIMRKQMLFLIGDSRMRLFYLHLQRFLRPNGIETSTPFLTDLSRVMERESAHPDQPILRYYPSKYPSAEEMEEILTAVVSEISRGNERRNVLLYETGAWPLYTYGVQGLGQFHENLTVVAKRFQRLPRDVVVIWMQTLPFHPGVQSSHNKWVSERRGIFQLIERFGGIVRKVAVSHNFTLWSSAHDLALRHPELYIDRVHGNRELNHQFFHQLLCASAETLQAALEATA
ncbi:hypothetical protein BV898_17099 [Hypsibius exemplaris]|uniref:Uncharacterized protein n=1 Tax=Hypsibius exemplaris TaxID=2072580 RepID=A0A9X6NEQ1_HYPEX|nr:hypothetical protein BV898_17099 [Hypsibius exemplaris]